MSACPVTSLVQRTSTDPLVISSNNRSSFALSSETIALDGATTNFNLNSTVSSNQCDEQKFTTSHLNFDIPSTMQFTHNQALKIPYNTSLTSITEKNQSHVPISKRDLGLSGARAAFASVQLSTQDDNDSDTSRRDSLFTSGIRRGSPSNIPRASNMEQTPRSLKQISPLVVKTYNG